MMMTMAVMKGYHQVHRAHPKSHQVRQIHRAHLKSHQAHQVHLEDRHVRLLLHLRNHAPTNFIKRLQFK